MPKDQPAIDPISRIDSLLAGAHWLLREWISPNGRPIEWTINNQLTTTERIALSHALAALALAEIANTAEGMNRDA